jgi:maltose O-acetyltransferase
VAKTETNIFAMKKLIKRLIGSLYGHSRDIYYETRYNFFRKKYNICSDFEFAGTDIRIYGEGEIVVGNKSYIGTNSSIELAKGQKVVIGNRCQISHNVKMYTSTADPDQDFRIPKVKPSKTGNIIIGDGVWIGANVFINPGVIIGDNSVIGANSIVTRDVPANAIVGGVPARLIRVKNL